MASKVYFTDFRTDVGTSVLDKFKKMLVKAGMTDIDYTNRFTAIKMHFGELGNIAYLRPNFAKTVADVVREQGGRPFLTDCNTLYTGSRKNALEHLDNALQNGFSPYSTGCHVIIADGLKGTDEALIDIDGQYVKQAKIGAAIADADVVISLTHFKGHEATGFGGTLKNLGMGCGSRAGKMEMHHDGKPQVNHTLCRACGTCLRYCAHGAITLDGKATINHEKCVGCGRCIGACPFDAVQPGSENRNEMLHKKIDEYSLAVLKGKPSFHISVIMDVSPCCDCHSENDAPLIPNVGMLASFDPVALDSACAALCNAQPRLENSLVGGTHGGDLFTTAFADTDWRVGLEYAEEIGLGTRDYELITVK